MKIVGLLLARNEDWVLGLSLRAALMWCDYVVVMLHKTTDQSHEIVDAVALETDVPMPDIAILGHKPLTGVVNRRVFAGTQHCQQFEEMRLRDGLLGLARRFGATHMVTIDADEVLSGNLLPTIRGEIENTPAGYVLQLPWLQLSGKCEYCDASTRAGCPINHYRKVMSSGMWARQNVTVAFPDKPEYHWKARAGYDHHHRHPMGLPFQPHVPQDLTVERKERYRSAGLMHLQFLSRRRLIAKQFWYQLTERLRWGYAPSVIRQRYVPTVEEADSAKVSACPESWWAPYSHLMQYLHIDREPWQETECKRILTEHPGIAEGLDDFGLLREWGL